MIAPTAPFVGSAAFIGVGFASSADFDNDGRFEVVVTPDQGGGPRIAHFNGASLFSTRIRLTPDCFAFEPTLRRQGRSI